MCYTIVAKDTYKNKHLCEYMQFNIRQCVSNSYSKKIYPFKKLYKGMKVMFIQNLYFKFGLINGTIGMIHEIVMDD